MRTYGRSHPDLDAVAVPQGHLVTRGSTAVLQVLTAAVPGATIEQVRGDGETHLGWWSDRLESREPSCLLRADTRDDCS